MPSFISTWALGPLGRFYCLVGIAIAGYRMNCKIQLLMALAAGSNSPTARAEEQAGHRVVNVQTNRPPTDSALSDSLNFLATAVNELRRTEILILTILIIMVTLFMIGMVMVLKRALSKQTRLYLEVKRGRTSHAC